MNTCKKTITMLRIGITALTIMSMAHSAHAASLTFGMARANAGEAGVQVDVNLDVDGGEEIASLQLDLQYDSRLSLVDVKAVSVATAADKSVAWNSQNGGTARVLLYGLNQNVISNGAALQLIFDVRSDAASGRADIIGDNVRAASPTGDNVSLTANGAYVNIAGGGRGLTGPLLNLLLTME